MAISIARKLVGRKDLEDVISVSLEGLVEAIEKFPAARTGQATEITAYIAGYIRYKIYRFRAEDTLIRVPQESQRRLSIRPMSVLSGANETTINQQDLIAINEILKIIAEDPIEKVIIKYRRKSFTDQEIAIKTNTSVSFINATRAKLEKKFDSIWRGFNG